MMRKRLSLVLVVLSAGVLAGGAVWAANQVVPAYLSKGEIEAAPKAVLAAADRAEAANPKVAPGKVTWHPSFAAACEASKKSGKPVLLFQLLGKLDHQFC
jgi:hypothetical protein